MRPEWHELHAEARERLDPQDRLEGVLAHPVFSRGLACQACCNTPDQECICLTPGEDEFREVMRRVRDRSTDYRNLPGGTAA